MAMQEEDRKYSELEERFRRELKQLEGRTLRRVLLQVVAPEINVVYLELDDGIWGIQGAMGSELLRLAKVSELPSELGPRAWYEPYVPGEQFAGSAIRQARAIGFAWNGHGAEFSFAGHQKATLLVQSIYAGDVPEGFGDCLRIGIGLYDYERQNAPDA